MNKWVKSLTAMALASSLFMVGCNNGEEKRKMRKQQHNKMKRKIRKRVEIHNLQIQKKRNKFV